MLWSVQIPLFKWQPVLEMDTEKSSMWKWTTSIVSQKLGELHLE
jgi:hypothetical protein